MKIPVWAEEYGKHAALNFGQALHGLRHIASHPRIDRTARRGTVRHAWRSIGLRAKLVANDMLFAILPPRWHHSDEELQAIRTLPLTRWFLAGLAPYRLDEKGELLPAEQVRREPRWDPRCDDD